MVTVVPPLPPTFTTVTLPKFVPLIVTTLPTYPDVPEPGVEATTPPLPLIAGGAERAVTFPTAK